MIDPWRLLTGDEQSVISTVTNREMFNEKIGNISDKEIENKVTLVRNFMDSMGGHSGGAIWRQIKAFEGVWLGDDPKFHEGGGVIFVVSDKTTFLDTLRNNGYEINTWYDRNLNKKAHPNDSAREITNTSKETAAHLTNDNSTNPNLFLLHWDKRSSEFKHVDRRYLSRWVEQLVAGKSHHEPFTAAQVREGLVERGIAT
ncbi:MAG: hypothetical protein J2P21_18480 [Chloracidobacterium sp.]|nr:hypothetical protein [Chloracidobacterium sp.]